MTSMLLIFSAVPMLAPACLPVFGLSFQKSVGAPDTHLHADAKACWNLLVILLRGHDPASGGARNPHVLKYTPVPVLRPPPADDLSRQITNTFLLHAGWGNPFFFCIFSSRCLEQRVDQVLVAFDPVRNQHPFAAVPLLDLDLARTLVVVAGSLDLRQQAGCAQLLQASVGDVQVFQAPAHVFAAHDLFAELALRGAHSLNRCQCRRDAAVVEHRTDLVLILQVALAGTVDHLLDIGDQRYSLAGHVPGRAQITLGGITRRDGVFLRACPPRTDDLVACKADFLRRFQRGLVHHAPAPENHIVGILLTDLQPLRTLLVAGVSNRNFHQLELTDTGFRFQRNDWFFTVSRVVVQEHDLLADQRTAVFGGQVFDDG